MFTLKNIEVKRIHEINEFLLVQTDIGLYKISKKYFTILKLKNLSDGSYLIH
jgi:hypothetical protein